MKAELTLPPELVDEIADKVIEKLKPLLPDSNGREDDKLMTIVEVAQFLNLYKKSGKVNREQIYQWVNNAQHGLGNFPYLKAGKLLRFSKSAVLKWLESR